MKSRRTALSFNEIKTIQKKLEGEIVTCATSIHSHITSIDITHFVLISLTHLMKGEMLNEGNWWTVDANTCWKAGSQYGYVFVAQIIFRGQLFRVEVTANDLRDFIESFTDEKTAWEIV